MGKHLIWCNDILSLRFIKMLNFITVFLFITFSSKQIIASKNVSIEVYYECLCPDSVNFITRQLYPTYKTLGKYIDIELIPAFGEVLTYNSFLNHLQTRLSCSMKQMVLEVGSLLVNMVPMSALEICTKFAFWTSTGIKMTKLNLSIVLKVIDILTKQLKK